MYFNLVPCPSTGPKIFLASPNILGQIKNRTAFSCLIAAVEKLNLPYEYHFWTGTKTIGNCAVASMSINFWLGTKCLDPPKSFGTCKRMIHKPLNVGISLEIAGLCIIVKLLNPLHEP